MPTGPTVADNATTMAALKQAVRRFADERNWEPYHSPKNLAMALACEAAELMEPFRWLECAESRTLTHDSVWREAVADELADVSVLLLNLSLALDIDLSDAIVAKMAKNAIKYPAPGK